LWAHYQGGDVDAGLAELKAPAETLIAICCGGPQP